MLFLQGAVPSAFPGEGKALLGGSPASAHPAIRVPFGKGKQLLWAGPSAECWGHTTVLAKPVGRDRPPFQGSLGAEIFILFVFLTTQGLACGTGSASIC